MFCSNPFAEWGVNTAQTGKGKVKHLGQMFLVDFPPNGERGLGEKRGREL